MTPIGGAVSSTLTIPNVQSNNAGSYTCQISNGSGSTNSTPLSLTVTAPTTYQADLLALSPLAFWPLSESSGTVAFDVAGGYNGTYIGGVSLGSPGPTNSVFGGSGLAATFDGFTGIVDIPEGPFNITNAITVAVWVNLPSFPPFSDIIGHGDQSWRITVSPSTAPPGRQRWRSRPADANSPTAIADGNWHFIAYTYDGTPLQGANGALYVDGVLKANNVIATVPAGDNLDVWIGGAPDYGTTFPGERLFPGSLADVAVFTRALSAAQVAGLFNGQVSLRITQSGPNVIISWPAGVLQQAPSISGPWTTNSARQFRPIVFRRQPRCGSVFQG